MVTVLVELLELPLGASCVEECWGAICEDTTEVYHIVWSYQVGDSGQDDIRITVGTDMLPTYIVVDGSKIAIEMEETGHTEVDTISVNFGLCFPVWIGLAKVLEWHAMEVEPFMVEKAGTGVGLEEGQKGGCIKKVRFEKEEDDMWEGLFCGVYLLKVIF